MMLEAGSNPRTKNKGGLTPSQLVDPANTGLKELIQKHEYASLSAGDFANVEVEPVREGAVMSAQGVRAEEEDEFSGSDEEERAEWERRRKERKR